MRKAKKQPSFFDEPELLRGNSCSLLAIVAVLILTLIVTIAVIVFLRISTGGITKLPLMFLNKNSQSIDSVDKRISGLQPDERVEIRLEESELNSLLGEISDFPLKKPRVKINSQNIIISGKTSNNFLSLNVQVYLKPVLNEGTLDWKIDSIKTGDVIAPKQISDKISENLLSKNILPGGDQIVVERADLFDGYLLVVGLKK